jgi:hypothetical protein
VTVSVLPKTLTIAQSSASGNTKRRLCDNKLVAEWDLYKQEPQTIDANETHMCYNGE